ncbi:MAG: ATP-binding cassette domain-containing protein [Acidobacteriota bacterium]|nr:ATP-binding cassette domain-containing protein [Acidobacteriota bacterium]
MEGGIRMSAALEIRALEIRRGARTIVARVDLDVHAGSVVALMGLSGSGKTTILRAVAGLEPHGGHITIAGGKAGLVFQSHHLFDHLSALDNVRLAPIHVRHDSRETSTVRAEALLEELGVAHRAHAWPRELSGGEAQRVAIARALAMDPAVLLLDEPTASLDPARRAELGRTLRTLAAGGRSLLLTSHDEDFVAEHADDVAILAAGRLVEAGPARQTLAAPAHPATRELLRMERSR